MILKKIVSGGQTGVDRAALDVALELGIACGGWCPQGRWAEDAPIEGLYPLIETTMPGTCERTRLNIKNSDGTLILIKTAPIGQGAELTIDLTNDLEKPLLVFTLNNSNDLRSIIEWIMLNNIQTLNITGPSESQNPGIYHDTCLLLHQLLVLTPALQFK